MPLLLKVIPNSPRMTLPKAAKSSFKNTKEKSCCILKTQHVIWYSSSKLYLKSQHYVSFDDTAYSFGHCISADSSVVSADSFSLLTES